MKHIGHLLAYQRSKEVRVSLGYRSVISQKTKYNNLDFFPRSFPFHSPGKSTNFWYVNVKPVIIEMISKNQSNNNVVMLLFVHIGCIKITETSNHNISHVIQPS